MSMTLVVVIAACVLFAGCTAPTPGQPTPTQDTTVEVTVSPSGTGTAPSTTAGTTTVPVTLRAANFAFNMSTITVPARATVVMTFVNDDAGVPHNFALYMDSSAATSFFKGTVVTGPATTTYTFTAPEVAGTYFFRCDPHPNTMTGSFVVT